MTISFNVLNSLFHNKKCLRLNTDSDIPLQVWSKFQRPLLKKQCVSHLVNWANSSGLSR